MNFNSKEILKRIKLQLGIRTDEELANYLGVAKPTINTWKTRNTIDFKLLLEKIDKSDWNYILYGEASGEVALRHSEPAEASQLRAELQQLHSEIARLHHELAKREGQIELLKSLLQEAERAKGGGVIPFKGADDPRLKPKQKPKVKPSD